VTGDDLLVLSETGAQRTPDWLMPRNFHNDGCYVISLGAVTKWLGEQAEALGVEIFPGFTAAEVLYNDDGSVKGVATGNLGVGKDGEPTDSFQIGMELHAKYTVFAEGARGHLGKQLIAKFKLDEGKDAQTFAIGIKELWESRPTRPSPAWWCTPPAGRSATTPLAAAFSTTWKATRSRWATSSVWTTRTPG
jgi:electron-transferring-flavoprotein dehydrogenase